MHAKKAVVKTTQEMRTPPLIMTLDVKSHPSRYFMYLASHTNKVLHILLCPDQSDILRFLLHASYVTIPEMKTPL